MPKRANLVGQKFGRLTVIAFDSIRKGHSYWLTECECSNKKVIAGLNLLAGNIVSCRCFQREQLAKVDRKKVKLRYDHARRISKRVGI
jgi:hypothetical protein